MRKRLLIIASAFIMLAAACNAKNSTVIDETVKNSSETSSEASTSVTPQDKPEDNESGKEDDYAAYLFASFGGNEPEKEKLFYSVSKDGYTFQSLNNGDEVLSSKSGTGCLRDPYIFQGEDSYYYMVATDMKSSLGWDSNRNIISWRSKDLINWTEETVIEIANRFETTKNADRVWAPQAIFDAEKGEYMLYWAMRIPGYNNSRTLMYYAYTKDMKTLTTAPQILFAPTNGHSAIDADITYNSDKYYMIWKDETECVLYTAVSDKMNSGYKANDTMISPKDIAAEGPCLFKRNGENKYMLVSDAYMNGFYIMQETTDLVNYKTLPKSSYYFETDPRHGTILPITQEQYDALLAAYPSEDKGVFNTTAQTTEITLSQGEKLTLPDTVTLNYSDGGTEEHYVEWDTTQLPERLEAGTYTIKGRVGLYNYSSPWIEERADPYVVKGEDGYYYFTASYPATHVNSGYDRIILRRSETLDGLANTEEVVIWKAHLSGIMAKHIWAPEMHFINGKWYMYFASGSSNNIWDIKPYVLECSGDPMVADNWIEKGAFRASEGDNSTFRGFSLDMTYFENNGKHYVIWAEKKPESNLYIAEIDPKEPWKLITKATMLSQPEFPWEKVVFKVNEGASVLFHEDKIHVFYSASGTGSEYCIGRLTADRNGDLLDATVWSKSEEPVLATKDLINQSGPGHNSFVIDDRGNLVLIYHARPSAHLKGECGTFNRDSLYDPCRHARIKYVHFDAKGTPLLNMARTDIVSDHCQSVTAIITIN